MPFIFLLYADDSQFHIKERSKAELMLWAQEEKISFVCWFDCEGGVSFKWMILINTSCWHVFTVSFVYIPGAYVCACGRYRNLTEPSVWVNKPRHCVAKCASGCVCLCSCTHLCSRAELPVAHNMLQSSNGEGRQNRLNQQAALHPQPGKD